MIGFEGRPCLGAPPLFYAIRAPVNGTQFARSIPDCLEQSAVDSFAHHRHTKPFDHVNCANCAEESNGEGIRRQ